MRILIVGAGSVGQLYGYHLARGGAEVDVYVRPRYTDHARQGYRLYDRSQGYDSTLIFEPQTALSSIDELRDYTCDRVLFCIPSTGLRGPWLGPFLETFDDSTGVISLLPGLDDRDHINQWIPDDRLGTGLITAVAYPAPLPGESLDHDATAFWLPPLTPALFSGPRPLLSPLISHLNDGGMRAKIDDNTPALAAFGSAFLMSFIATLETLDWSLERLKKTRDHRRQVTDTANEIMAIVAATVDARPPMSMKLLGPTAIRGALSAAPMVTPFDLETYLRVHFTKVGDQTRLFFRDYIDKGAHLGLQTTHCERLLAALD